MHGFRALLAGLLISATIGAIAWYVVSTLGQLLQDWVAGGCGLEILVSVLGGCH
jgi:hypothetical protein